MFVFVAVVTVGFLVAFWNQKTCSPFSKWQEQVAENVLTKNFHDLTQLNVSGGVTYCTCQRSESES